MTPQNLAQHRNDPNMAFWQNLKEGSDHFEALRQEPKVAVCGRRYVFGGADVAQGNCSPAIEPAVAQKRAQDEQQVAELVARGVQPVQLVYNDGSGHETFRQAIASATVVQDGSLVVDARTTRRLGDVSRPEALAAGPQQILLDATKPKEAVALTAAAKPATAGPALTPRPSAVAGKQQERRAQSTTVQAAAN
jgi:hypothetical protein